MNILDLSSRAFKVLIGIATLLLVTSIVLNWYADKKGFIRNKETGVLTVGDLESYEKYHKWSKWTGIVGILLLLFIFALSLADKIIPQGSAVRQTADNIMKRLGQSTKDIKSVATSKLDALRRKLSSLKK